MLIRESKTRLLEMLATSELTIGALGAPDIGKLVGAFERFCAISVSDSGPAGKDGDGVLAQFGTFAFGGPLQFVVTLTRQFIESQDDAAIWQLGCSLHWDPSAETTHLGRGELWSFGYPLDEFFARVRTLPGFAWALSTTVDPVRTSVSLEVV